jgi:hypothetical protein
MTPSTAPIATQAIAGHAAIRFLGTFLKTAPCELIINPRPDVLLSNIAQSKSQHFIKAAD